MTWQADRPTWHTDHDITHWHDLKWLTDHNMTLQTDHDMTGYTGHGIKWHTLYTDHAIPHRPWNMTHWHVREWPIDDTLTMYHDTLTTRGWHSDHDSIQHTDHDLTRHTYDTTHCPHCLRHTNDKQDRVITLPHEPQPTCHTDHDKANGPQPMSHNEQNYRHDTLITTCLTDHNRSHTLNRITDMTHWSRHA